MPHHGQAEVGARYGRWTVLRKFGAGFQSLCRCTCGLEAVRLDSILLRGLPGSGGCLRCRSPRNAKLREEYFCRFGHQPPDDFRKLVSKAKWAIRRCHDASDKDYAYYGGRGICVCDEWREDVVAFAAHLATLARDSEARLLDRIDNDGSYTPGNVRFATKSEQCYNKRNPGKRDSERKVMLTPGMERCIRRLHAKGESKAELARLYCVRITTICSVLEGRQR